MKIILSIFLAFAINCSLQAQEQQPKEQQFTGKYRTVMGVRNSLSCYAFNAGYLTIDTDKKISVSFDELKGDKVRNGKITVVGYFKEVTHESGESDPCSSGTRKIFIVRSFTKEK